MSALLSTLTSADLGPTQVGNLIRSCVRQLLSTYSPQECDLLLVCRGGALFAEPAIDLGFRVSYIYASNGVITEDSSLKDIGPRVILCDVLCDSAKTLTNVESYVRKKYPHSIIEFLCVVSTDVGFSTLSQLGQTTRLGAIGGSPSAIARSCSDIHYDFGEIAALSCALPPPNHLHE